MMTADQLCVLSQFLVSQPASALAGRLLAAAEVDPRLMTNLQSWYAQHLAAKALTSKAKLKSWKVEIAKLLKDRSDFYDRHDLPTYIDSAEKAVEILNDLVAQDALQGREACFFAMHQLYVVGEHTDDSDGMLAEVMSEVAALIVQTLKSVPPMGKDAAAFGQAWHDLLAQDPWGTWNEEATLDAAGADVQAWANTKAAQDWQDWLVRLANSAKERVTSQARIDALKTQQKKTPEDRRALTQAERAHSDRFGGRAGRETHLQHERWQLHRRYLRVLERQQDIHGQYELLLQCTQAEAWAEVTDWTRLIEWCNVNGRGGEMLRWVQAGLKAFPDDWRLKDLLLQCYERDGLHDEAFAIRITRVMQTPNVDNYALALKAAANAGKNVAQCREDLFAWALEIETSKAQRPAPQYGGIKDALTALPQRNVSLRVAWLVYEQRFDEALDLAQTAQTLISDALLDTLAQHFQASQPQVAGQLLRRLLNANMSHASSPYSQELALVQRILPLLLCEERRLWLALLRGSWRAKRNFIAGLDKIKLE